MLTSSLSQEGIIHEFLQVIMIIQAEEYYQMLILIVDSMHK